MEGEMKKKVASGRPASTRKCHHAGKENIGKREGRVILIRFLDSVLNFPRNEWQRNTRGKFWEEIPGSIVCRKVGHQSDPNIESEMASDDERGWVTQPFDCKEGKRKGKKKKKKHQENGPCTKKTKTTTKGWVNVMFRQRSWCRLHPGCCQTGLRCTATSRSGRRLSVSE